MYTKFLRKIAKKDYLDFLVIVLMVLIDLKVIVINGDNNGI